MGTYIFCVLGCLLIASTGVASLKEAARQHTNDTFGRDCKKFADCNTKKHQYCDSISSVCRCNPNTAYDEVAQQCRALRQSSKKIRNIGPRTGGFPDHNLCFGKDCVKFCPAGWWRCNSREDIFRQMDNKDGFLLVSCLFGAVCGFVLAVLVYPHCRLLRV